MSTDNRYMEESWPVIVRHIRENEYEINGKGTTYQVIIITRTCGVLVIVPNWNRCGYITYRGTVHPKEIAENLDMGGDMDTYTLARGLSEIMRSYILSSPEVENFNRQRRALIEKLRT